MPRFQSSFPVSLVCAAALLLLTLAGCEDNDNYTPPATTNFIQMAPMAPPPPTFEVEPQSPSPSTIAWRPGYYKYDGSNFYWVGGEFINRPSVTAVWSPDHWIQHTYGWAFVPGYWQ